ncbi:hypothetical protein H2204_004585 [Knufia peltigerae]|uniref:Uncharacterized protein n=1 Tax=Knufia peltigerae TaxID=1002370 RepID=A0AA38Y746_9EURO|nr:hypothetical protein H2204_004585 [Knufia peltigerae]
MPTILTPQGWVKVAAPKPRKKVVNPDPTSAFKGPLAYFSCQPLPSSKKEPISNRPQFPYDLSASPEKLRHQGEGKAKIAGKNRIISAPQLPIYDQDDGYEAAEEDHSARGGGVASPSSSLSAARRHKTSPRSRKEPPSRQYDDLSSSSSGSSGGGRSTKSYSRHRPVEAAPRPASMYHHRPPPPQPPAHGGYYGYNDYPPPPPRPSVYERPTPPSNARSMSYSWYNATTPLNL